ncbi:phage tail protein [Neptunicella sp. SCSIO 80796]|uniref:phage tail protein n=1 Tax=Neptunicella plasticusilytica TaxID=3117012 RepID=UPI003A4DE0E9
MPPVIVGVAAYAGATAAGYAVGTAIAIGVAAAVGTVALTEAMKPDLGDTGVDTTNSQALTTAANQPRKIIYGLAVVGAQLVGYADPVISGQKYDVMVLHIAGHPCESVEIYEIEGKSAASLSSVVTSTFYTGEQITADPTALQYVQGWTNNHIGYDQTYAVLKIKRDPNRFPQGLNETKFLVKGKRVYDPRKDDTAGGSGAHRIDTPATWEWSNNPELCAIDYCRFHGYKPQPNRRFDWDFVAQAASYCDEETAYYDRDGTPQTEPRFSCNGVLTNALRPVDGLKNIMDSFGAKPYRIGGKIYIKPAMYSGPATLTIKAQSGTTLPNYRPHRPEKERCNTVRCQYVAPDKKWQQTDAPVVANAVYKTADGAHLEHDLKLLMVTSETQAQRLGKLALERNRAGFVANQPLPGLRLDVVAGSNLIFVDPESGISKEFVVEEAKHDTSRRETLVTLAEDGEAIYPDDFTPSQGNLTPNTTLPDTTNVNEVTDVVYTETPADSYRQGILSWQHPVPASVVGHTVTIKTDPGGVVVQELHPVGQQADINGLPIGSYLITVAPRNRFGRTPDDLTEYSLAIGVIVTPTGLPNVTAKPGMISVEPPTPLATNTTYEWRWHTSVDATVIPAGQNRALVLNNIVEDVTYSIEYRLVTPTGEGDWIEIEIDGVEQTLYTWLAYADDDTGTGISLDPTGKAYYGVATGRTVATASIADPAIYTWLPQAAGGGEPAISGWLSNTVHAVSVAADGTGGDYSGAATTISIYVGLVDDSMAWSISASASSGVTGSLTGRTYTVNAMSVDQGYVDLTATREGYSDITQRFTIVKLRTGADGAAGVPGTPGADGTTTFTWIRYANTAAGGGISNDPAGKAYIGFAYNKTTATESTNPADYTWSKILGDDGQDGQDGIQGPPGADGTPRYTWIKYADNAAGSGLSNSPTGKTYIGIATNKTTATESTNPSDYTWSKYVGDDGPQGVPGTPGADGTPRYTWIKYADNASGGGISNNPTGKAYIGFAYNKTTSAESSTPGDYAWSKILGEDGSDGQDGIQGPPGADGTPRYTWIKYADNGSGSGLSNNPTGKKYIGIATNKTTATESSSAGDYTWSKYVGEDGVDGQDGQDGQDGGIGPPGPPGPIATARTYSDSGSSNSLPGGSWQTLVNLSVPAGTWDFDMEVQANASNVTLVTLKVRWLKNGSVNGGYEDTDISKFPSVSLSYHNVSTISAASYQLQVYASNYVDSGSASGYLTAVEQL